jgi:hypothetical protein
MIAMSLAPIKPAHCMAHQSAKPRLLENHISLPDMIYRPQTYGAAIYLS